MGVEEIKAKVATLSREEQDEIIAFLFHLRHAKDAAYQAAISQRLQDKDAAHWLTPDQFERKLDQGS